MYIYVRTVNNKSQAREKFHGLMDSIQIEGKLLQFALSVLKVLKKAIAQEIRQENFRASSKIHKSGETFLLLNFCLLQYML